MEIIADLTIIGIILLSTFLAYRKGFVKLSISLFAFIIAIVITFIFYKPISNFVINATGIDEAIENGIYEKANSIMEENKQDDSLTEQIIETTQNNMLPETARNLAINIVTGGTIIVLFVGIKIALRFITILADLVAKLPIIKHFNKIGATIYGVIRGILIVYVLLLVVGIFAQINPNNTASESIEQSYLAKTMYENNILKVFFTNFSF